MGMYSLIEDARMKALDAANCWHETPAAQELIAKIDAFERLSDRWYSECAPAASGFMEAAREAENALEDIRDAAIDAAADAHSDDHESDEWTEAWIAAGDDAPPVSQVLASARRNYAGNSYLEGLAA